MVASDDKAANLAQAEHWVRQAAGSGAKVVALPEVFIWRGHKKLERAQAEPIPGASSTAMAKLAQELGIYLLAGSLLEEIPGSDRVFNTSLLFGPAGNLLASYRKIHLFDVDLAGGIVARESDTRAAGEAVTSVETDLGTMGLSVCYDLRFPELYRELSRRQAHVIFVPSAFTEYTGKAHWEPLLRARAIENQVYIIAPNQFGKNPKSFETHGHSMIIDPWGRIVAQLEDGAGFIIAELDPAYLAKIRAELPCLTHRIIS